MRHTENTKRLAGLGGAKWEVYLKTKELVAQGRDIIELTIDEPDVPTPATLIDAATDATRRGRTSYSSGRGEAGLRAGRRFRKSARKRALCDVLVAARAAVPNAIMVEDSDQPIYTGNLYYDHDRPGGWFEAATGLGALGYDIPAAVGAALAAPGAPMICITGDGGAKFSLPEMICAMDENSPIGFMIWNNYGYQEIATLVQAVGVTVVGCDLTPPDFEGVAQACGMPFWRCEPEPALVADALRHQRPDVN